MRYWLRIGTRVFRGLRSRLAGQAGVPFGSARTGEDVPYIDLTGMATISAISMASFTTKGSP